MNRKRKRDIHASTTGLFSTKPLPLTRPNLCLLGQPSEALKPFPAPFQTLMYPAPQPTSPSKGSSSGRSKPISSLTTAEKILNAYSFYIDRRLPHPPYIQRLVEGLLEVRHEEDITPKTQFISKTHEAILQMEEDNQIHHLADQITYREKLYADDGVGESLIARGRNDQWGNTIPKPIGVDAKNLEAAMEVLGAPKKPKPDFSFGYSDEAFSKEEEAQRMGLPKDMVVYDSEPWFPYMTMQWKCALESSKKGGQQVRRDTAAAIDTLYRFFKLAGEEPSPALTCCFSVVIHSEGFDLRIHYRRVENGSISYVGDRVGYGARWYIDKEIFEVRRRILHVLEWARNERLPRIKAALKRLSESRQS